MRKELLTLILCAALFPAQVCASNHDEDKDEEILRELGEQNAENTTFGTPPLGDMTENF